MTSPVVWRCFSWCSPMLVAMVMSGAPWMKPAAAADAWTNCPLPAAITPTHLFGLWQLTLGNPEHPTGEGQLVFERHPEYPDSVRGTLERSAQGKWLKVKVAGDVTDQGFQLEESADGVTIDAVWSGDVSPTSCGKEIKGWRRVSDGNSTREAVTEQPFLLKKAPGWR